MYVKKIVPKERSPPYRAAKPAVVGSFENNVGHFFPASLVSGVSAGGSGILHIPSVYRSVSKTDNLQGLDKTGRRGIH